MKSHIQRKNQKRGKGKGFVLGVGGRVLIRSNAENPRMAASVLMAVFAAADRSHLGSADPACTECLQVLARH